MVTLDAVWLNINEHAKRNYGEKPAIVSLHPENIHLFEEYFGQGKGTSVFIDHNKNVFFTGVPITFDMKLGKGEIKIL